MTGSRIFFLAFPLALLFVVLALRSSVGAHSPVSQNTSTRQFPTEPMGAARCKGCHGAEVEGYARSAMAHSLRRAEQEPTGVVNANGATITPYSNASGSWQRWQSGGETSTYRINYVIGSGNHANGYLAEVAGHLFQSPVAFYKSRNAYDLAPGYENTQEPDFTRPVAEGCVFCHSGTELHINGTDNRYRPPVFAEEAITCERCHGPGERHLADPRAETIVNPAKLERGARDSICEQCHLMGVARVVNPGHEFRDFQPGQRLETIFTTYHDAFPPEAPADEFKVISHVEQLALSQCARQSEGKLWCGTCHDPHNQPLEPVAYYRSRCLACHTRPFAAPHPDAQSNCIGCHMPRRDARDGGHTAFTDHRIQRRPLPQTNLPSATDIAAWREPAPELQKRNLGIALINAGFQRHSPQLMVRGYRLLTEVQMQFSDDPEVFMWMGTALLAGRKSSEAELAFERAAQLNPNSAAAETDIAAALQQAGQTEKALEHLKHVAAVDPMHLSATGSLLRLYESQGNSAAAAELSGRVRQLMDEAAEAVPATEPGNRATAAKPAEQVFKNIKVLEGIPSDQVVPSMRFIASSLGVGCMYCHVHDHFEDDAKKTKETARRMMRMVLALNQNRFAGSREITCYSCHRGAAEPEGMPGVAPIGAAAEDAGKSKMEDSPELLPTSRELLSRYIGALGGEGVLAQLSTRIERGSAQVWTKNRTYEMPVEIFTKGPDKQEVVEHSPEGDRVSVMNGGLGFTKMPGQSTHRLEGAELDEARIAADLKFPLHIEQTFPDLRVEYPEEIEGTKCYVLTARRQGEPEWKFFFAANSGLLLRLVHFSGSPLGLYPRQIDYRDYHEIDGVQVPFQQSVAQPDVRTTIRIDSVQQNVPIDDAKFADPPPSVKSR